MIIDKTNLSCIRHTHPNTHTHTPTDESLNPPVPRGPRVSPFIERSLLNFLFYKGKSVSRWVKKQLLLLQEPPIIKLLSAVI